MTKLSRDECTEQGGHCYEPPAAVLAECKHCGTIRIAIPQQVPA